MGLPKKYKPLAVEERLQTAWQADSLYQFHQESEAPIFSIDTPPPTVSGYLHMGHVYSYSQTDFVARYRRMRGDNVFYPMGFDDNGLPTDRLVESRIGKRASEVGRQQFIAQCLEISEEIEETYRTLWKRLGLSIDWRYSYRTIDERSRRLAQLTFLELLRRDLAYRKRAPAIWCPECGTAIAQAEVTDFQRDSTFYTLAFRFDDGVLLPIATTRPELLAACVAIFVHPDDPRYRDKRDLQVMVPLYGQKVPMLTDPIVDSEKGTGVVMCCTFGDTTDVEWWQRYDLALVEAIDLEGRMTAAAGELADLPIHDARRKIVQRLERAGALLDRRPVEQTVRVHERCDTPVEFIVTSQWFIKLLPFRDQLLEAGDRIDWYPPHMKARYRNWLENLGWDWCISRQRYFGVPFPLWYCADCREPLLAEESTMPVDPMVDRPPGPCHCGSTRYVPEQDVMDTWATSSLSPQIVGGWRQDEERYRRLFPMSLRPQAHEIIRTWALYTIARSLFHFESVPWKRIMISGWGVAPEGGRKISKSRGGGPAAPEDMIERYSADALRYWAASTGTGRDSVISEEKIQNGAKLVTKLWNVARFTGRFFEEGAPPAPAPLSPADRWILSRTQQLIERVTGRFEALDYAGAKHEIESFFRTELADNYLEMAKVRLYNREGFGDDGARYALYQVLLAVLKLFAPILPFVTDEIYRHLYQGEGSGSIHATRWPEPDPALLDEPAERTGKRLVEIATHVRRYKSEQHLSPGSEISTLYLASPSIELITQLQAASADLKSVTRASQLYIFESLPEHVERIAAGAMISIGACR